MHKEHFSKRVTIVTIIIVYSQTMPKVTPPKNKNSSKNVKLALINLHLEFKPGSKPLEATTTCSYGQNSNIATADGDAEPTAVIKARVGDGIFFHEDPAAVPLEEKQGEIADFVKDGMMVRIVDDNDQHAGSIMLPFSRLLRTWFFLWPQKSEDEPGSRSDPDAIVKVDTSNIMHLRVRRNPDRSREILRQCCCSGHQGASARDDGGRGNNTASESVVGDGGEENHSWNGIIVHTRATTPDATPPGITGKKRPARTNPTTSTMTVKSRLPSLPLAKKPAAHSKKVHVVEKSREVCKNFSHRETVNDHEKQRREADDKKKQCLEKAENTPSKHNVVRSPSQKELFSCTTRRAREALFVWYQRYHELIEYRNENGDCNVPQKYPQNPALGIWYVMIAELPNCIGFFGSYLLHYRVNKMRMEKKHYDEGERSVLCEEKISALDDIDFQWAKRKGDVLWEERFQDLKQFFEQKGHCRVPTKYKKDTSLGRWVSTQRKQYKEMKDGKKTLITAERIARLEALGFCWNLGERDETNSERDEMSSS